MKTKNKGYYPEKPSVRIKHSRELLVMKQTNRLGHPSIEKGEGGEPAVSDSLS